jgi:serine/threonine protein kinase
MTAQLQELRAVLAGLYGVERELGQGGMATVYLARDLKHNRQVAIKVLRPDLAEALGDPARGGDGLRYRQGGEHCVRGEGSHADSHAMRTEPVQRSG